MGDNGATVVAVSPRAASRPWRSKRGPRSDEIALLRGLAAGPAPVTGGPLGRCSKRGWCRAVLLEAPGGGRHGTAAFELTTAGRALIEGRRAEEGCDAPPTTAHIRGGDPSRCEVTPVLGPRG